MPIPTPTPSAIPARGSGTPALVAADRLAALQAMRDHMKQANVPQPQSDQVTQQQEQVEVFVGYVTGFYVSSTGETMVMLDGYSDSSSATTIRFHWPPNNPTYLPEFKRAQDNPDYRVKVWNDGDQYSPKISFFYMWNPKAIAANAAAFAAALNSDNTGST